MNTFIVIFTDLDGKFVSTASFNARFAWEVTEHLEDKYKNTSIRIGTVVAVAELSPLDL